MMLYVRRSLREHTLRDVYLNALPVPFLLGQSTGVANMSQRVYTSNPSYLRWIIAESDTLTGLPSNEQSPASIRVAMLTM